MNSASTENLSSLDWGRIGLRCMTPLLIIITAAVALSPALAEEPAGTAHVYKRIGSRDLRLWVLSPKNGAPPEEVPAIVFFHGGGWVAGEVSQFNRQAEYLARRGMTAVQVEYRLVARDSDELIVAPVQDAKSAIRWLKANHRIFAIDPERIAAAGGSAGGQLAAFLGTKEGFDDPADDLALSSDVQVLVLFNPAIDLGPNSQLHKRGGEKYRELSPSFEPKPRCKAALILSGEADETVPASVLKLFSSRLNAANVDCRLVLYPGLRHGFFNLPASLGPTLEEVDRFFRDIGWLKGEPDLQLIGSLSKEN